MIPVTQKPPADVRTTVARPKTGITPVRTLRVPDPDWPDLHAIAGRELASVIHQFVRWYLRRPGAKLPARPSAERVAEVVREREASTQ
jgi:hypothetical protein